jgi:hypothetical protein
MMKNITTGYVSPLRNKAFINLVLLATVALVIALSLLVGAPTLLLVLLQTFFIR